jgi:hypothetical protein
MSRPQVDDEGVSDVSETHLDLAEVLGKVRAEIARAERAASGENVRFAVSSVRVELTVAIEKSVTGKGGIKFWVVEAGTEAARKNTTTHLLAFDLQPTSVATGHRPHVSGAAFDDEI